MRNRLVYACIDIHRLLVRDAVCDDVPVLIAPLEPLVPREAR